MFVIVVLCALLCCTLSACIIADPEITSVTQELTDVPEETTVDNAKEAEQHLQDTIATPEVKLIALEVGSGSDSKDGGNHVSECDFWNPELTVMHQNDAAPETAAITVDDVTYEGTYRYSRVNVPETFRTDYYVFPDKNGEFAVNSVTGELVWFALSTSEAREQGDLTAEECLDVANAFAGLFADVSEYTLTVTPGKSLHSYTYRKNIGDIETGEFFIVSVSTAGKARTFGSSMLGAFTSETSVLTTKNLNFEQSIDLLSSDQAEAVLGEKINTIYADLDKAYLNPDVSYLYEIKESKLVILPDDTLGMLYTVEIDVSRPGEKGTVHSLSLTQILIRSE